MTFAELLESRMNTTLQVLGLPALARTVLDLLVRMDTNREFANQIKEMDAYNRSGVLSWRLLASEVMGQKVDPRRLEAALRALDEWGLLQIVGRNSKDPVVPGSAPIRLTNAGRTCLGLSPSPHHKPPAAFTQGMPWTILHGASREACILRARETVGDAWSRPFRAFEGEQGVAGLAGRLAVALTSGRAAIVDAFGVSDNDSNRLEELIWRTSHARGPRVLMVSSPNGLRVAALGTDALFQWVQPEVDQRGERHVTDKRVTKALLVERKGPTKVSAPDISGVPDTDLAHPERVNTQWDDLYFPAAVQLQLQQALAHARYRLVDESTAGIQKHGRGRGYRLLLSGLPGTGKSMTAEALATALDKPLIRLDLSSVLSKWLGETEKLLGQIFTTAEAADAVLVLDEAESLLRQRKSGKDSGNALSTGVAYLLTRLDRYTGVMVGTTNRVLDLDEAFFRRFDDYIILPIPDQPTRRRLWRTMLGDPPGVDAGFLAKSFSISGGLIRGASIRARAWSKGFERPIDNPLVLASLARELEKNNQSTSATLLPPYRDQVLELLGDNLT